MGALDRPYILDPQRCVATTYGDQVHTMPRAVIPEKARKRIGMKSIGCDICQMACPKNRDLPERRELVQEIKILAGLATVHAVLILVGRTSHRHRRANAVHRKRESRVALRLDEVAQVEFVEDDRLVGFRGELAALQGMFEVDRAGLQIFVTAKQGIDLDICKLMGGLNLPGQ